MSSLLLLALLAAQDPTPRLGTISFPTSEPGAAQSAFLEGVLYLHSFEYPSAARAFRRAQSLSPRFAMAYWGEAMTFTHAVWNEQDLAAARDALRRLAATAAERRALAPTPREQGYLAAVEILYGEGSKPRRDTLYAAAMERLVREHPADLEAKAFYALALLGLNQGVRDTVTYLRAAAWADTVFAANPDHPGGAHYLIHSLDDPAHAARGLAAARAYSKIAPDAAHAQHMTTHIFLALGMWDDVVSQNRIALSKQAQLPGHYSSWLVYALIQQGRYALADSLMTSLRKNLGDGGAHTQHAYWADMRAHYLLHTAAWDSPVASWRSPHDRMTLAGELSDVYSGGVIGFRRRDPAAIVAAAGELERLIGVITAERGADDPLTGTARVMGHQLAGMGLLLAGKRQEGIARLREAAAIEDRLPNEFGPPAIAEPSHELLGSALRETDPGAAVLEYRRGLAAIPGRSRGLEGLARAALAAGDKGTAAAALRELRGVWHLADPPVQAELRRLDAAVEKLP